MCVCVCVCVLCVCVCVPEYMIYRKNDFKLLQIRIC